MQQEVAPEKGKNTKQTNKQRKNKHKRSSYCGAAGTNPTSIHEGAGLIPGLVQWVGDPVLL